MASFLSSNTVLTSSTTPPQIQQPAQAGFVVSGVAMEMFRVSFIFCDLYKMFYLGVQYY